MGSILKFFLAALLLFIVVTIAAFVYLEWWQALLVVAGMIVAIVLGVKYLIRNIGKILGKAMLKAFEVKAQVMREAEATVNHVEATLAPAKRDSDDDDDEDDEDDEESTEAAKFPLAYYRLDVTITPRGSAGLMNHWDVDDLRVVPFDAAKPSLDLMACEKSGLQEEGYDLENVQILENGQFIDDEQGKHEGSKQIRAIVGVPTHVRQLKFQYYAEQFGKVVLPPPLVTQIA
ncbi:MAG: hypothetical protein ABIP55_03465 [Tepidisphaeraceae bacterium]